MRKDDIDMTPSQKNQTKQFILIWQFGSEKSRQKRDLRQNSPGKLREDRVFLAQNDMPLAQRRGRTPSGAVSASRESRNQTMGMVSPLSSVTVSAVDSAAAACDQAGLSAKFYPYSHSESAGRSSRGARLSQVRGRKLCSIPQGRNEANG
jgi:hypothetical protein